MNSSVTSSEQPFALEGGIVVAPSPVADPFAVLDDLMVVIEALCPQWPERETFANMGKCLL